MLSTYIKPSCLLLSFILSFTHFYFFYILNHIDQFFCYDICDFLTSLLCSFFSLFPIIRFYSYEYTLFSYSLSQSNTHTTTLSSSHTPVFLPPFLPPLFFSPHLLSPLLPYIYLVYSSAPIK